MLRTGKPCIRLFYIGLFFTSGTVSAANVAATGCTPAARRFERDKLAHISVATKNCAVLKSRNFWSLHWQGWAYKTQQTREMHDELQGWAYKTQQTREMHGCMDARSVATKNCAIFGRFIGAHLVKTAQATRKAVNVVHACNARLAPVWFGDERSTGTPQNSLFKDAHTGWTRRLKACTINRESGI